MKFFGFAGGSLRRTASRWTCSSRASPPDDTRTGRRNVVSLSPLAGKPAPASLLIDVGKLLAEYHARKLDLGDPQQLVNFGTSGHRGTSENGTFTETHILAITQALCDFRTTQQISGPLFIGKDTHALSGAAQRTAIEVLAGNDAVVFYQVFYQKD